MFDIMVKLFPSRLNPPIQLTTFVHNFGIIIPCKSGVVWQQQTQGVMCRQVFIEGIFIPLKKPHDLLEKLKNANYRYDKVIAKRTLEKIRGKGMFDIEWEWTERPSNKYPENQEGIHWIILTKWDKVLTSDLSKELDGKPVALVYPNCD